MKVKYNLHELFNEEQSIFYELNKNQLMHSKNPPKKNQILQNVNGRIILFSEGDFIPSFSPPSTQVDLELKCKNVC